MLYSLEANVLWRAILQSVWANGKRWQKITYLREYHTRRLPNMGFPFYRRKRNETWKALQRFGCMSIKRRRTSMRETFCLANLSIYEFTRVRILSVYANVIELIWIYLRFVYKLGGKNCGNCDFEVAECEFGEDAELW